MSARDRNAAVRASVPELADYHLPASLAEQARAALTALSQANTLANVRGCLAEHLAALEALALDPRDAQFTRELLEDFADRQHGRVWPR